MVLVLQRKLSDAHLERMSVGMKLMKQTQQHIEQRNDRGQTSLKKGFQTVIDPFKTIDDRDQGERGLHFHPVVPTTFGAELAVLRHAAFAAKTVIGQHDAAPAELLDQLMELVI